VARRSRTALEDQSSIPDAGKNNVLVTRSDWPTLVGSVCYASLVSASADWDLKPGFKCCGLQDSLAQQRDYTTRAYISRPWWRHIYCHLSVSIAQPKKTTYTHTHIITGKRSCTAELLMTGWLRRSVSSPLHNARKTSASEVHYSQEALYQKLYTYIHTVHTAFGKLRPQIEYVILIIGPRHDDHKNKLNCKIVLHSHITIHSITCMSRCECQLYRFWWSVMEYTKCHWKLSLKCHMLHISVSLTNV